MSTTISLEMREKIIRRITQVLVTALVQGVILFLASWDLGWTWGGSSSGSTWRAW